MKKLKLLLFVLLFVGTVKAQYFDGVLIDNSIVSVISKFKEKGYTVKTTKSNVTIMSGTLMGKEIELYIFCTPISKITSKISVYLPKKYSWYEIKNEYREMKALLNEKYGTPDNEYEFFKSPYYEGDGYELSAIANDKGYYSTFWFNRNNTSIAVEITEYNQVRIAYENDKNMERAKIEKDKVNKNVF